MNEETARVSLSMYGMFMDSDIFMKLLILGLLFASVCCWAIIFDKLFCRRFLFTTLFFSNKQSKRKTMPFND